jgi:hypothetical protein
MDHPKQERFQFSVAAVALAITLCSVGLAAGKAVGLSLLLLTWAFSVGAVVLMAERLVFRAQRAKTMPGPTAARREQRNSLALLRTCSRCGAEVEPEFEACWSCGTWFDTIAHSASVAATVPVAHVVEGPCEDGTMQTEDDNAMVDRAWRAALMGLFLCPLLPNIYSAWLLMQIRTSGRLLNESDQRRFRRTAVLDLAVCAPIGLFLACLGIGWFFVLTERGP